MPTEVIDAETGEITNGRALAIAVDHPLAVGETKEQSILHALVRAYEKAGTLELTDAEVEKLMAPFADEQVEILPYDGALYIPHILISDRLNRVVKPGQWALIRRRDWFDQGNNTMYGEYILVIRGCYIGESVGEQKHYKTNKDGSVNERASLANALEGTAGECLRRIAGKRLSCGSQVWDKNYCEAWKEKYAVYDYVEVNGTKKRQWFKRKGEKKSDPPQEPKPPKQKPVDLSTPPAAMLEWPDAELTLEQTCWLTAKYGKSGLDWKTIFASLGVARLSGVKQNKWLMLLALCAGNTDPGEPPPAPASAGPEWSLETNQAKWVQHFADKDHLRVENLVEICGDKQRGWPILSAALKYGTPVDTVQEFSSEPNATVESVLAGIKKYHGGKP